MGRDDVWQRWWRAADQRLGLAERWQRCARWAPLALFVGGFLFDVVTLGGEVNPLNLAVVCLYALGVGVTLTLRGRGLLERHDRWLALALHFFVGSLFSALVVLYFKSAGQLLGLVVVLGLFGAMVWNELTHQKDAQKALLWGIYCVSVIMLLHFVLPYLLGSVSPWWFYIGTGLGVALVWGFRRLAGAPRSASHAATGAAGLLVVLYLVGAIPPVPLVLERSLVGADFDKRDGEYTVAVEPEGVLERFGLARPTVHRHPGQPVHVLSAVSAPAGAQAPVEHRWYRRTDDGWVLSDTIAVRMRGGRKAGWRFWSNKRNIVDGVWRVETALTGGPAMGYEVFEVVEVSPDTPIARRREAL